MGRIFKGLKMAYMDSPKDEQFNFFFEADRIDKEYFDKIEYSKKRVIEWYHYYNGQVVIAFSGGVDSLALLHFVRKIIMELFGVSVPGCFVDTGVEFREIRDTVGDHDNVITVKPIVANHKVRFSDIVLGTGYFKGKKLAGYPFWSKEVSMAILRYRNTNDPIQKELRLYGGINPTSGREQAQTIPDTFHALAKKGKYPISNICCHYLKKSPSYLIQKQTGRVPYIGMKESDSNLRKKTLARTGCNNYEAIHPTSNPLRHWNDQDIKRYVKENKLKVCSLYNIGYEGTGCTGCILGIGKDVDKFLRLKEYHYSTYDYYINKLDYKGFFKEVYNLSGVKIKY